MVDCTSTCAVVSVPPSRACALAHASVLRRNIHVESHGNILFILRDEFSFSKRTTLLSAGTLSFSARHYRKIRVVCSASWWRWSRSRGHRRVWQRPVNAGLQSSVDGAIGHKVSPIVGRPLAGWQWTVACQREANRVKRRVVGPLGQA